MYDNFKNVFLLIDEASIRYSADVLPVVDPSIVTPNEATKDVTLSVLDSFKSHYMNYVFDKAAASESLGLVFKALEAMIEQPELIPVLSVLATGLVTATGALLDRAASERLNAIDPPDSDYKTLVSPVAVEQTEIENLPDGLAKNLANNAVELQAVSRAADISRNRADGARAANDLLWEGQQLEAAARYSAEASALESTFIYQYAQLESEINSVPETQGVDVSSFLQSNPLPDDLVQLLGAFGETPVQIADMGKNLANLIPGPDDDPTAGIVALRASTVETEAIAFQDLTRTISVRTDGLDLAARDPTSSELAELDSKQSKIVNELNQPGPQASIAQELADFQDAVLGLALDTNNMDAVQRYLDFGQTAVVGLQNTNLASLNHVPAFASIAGQQIDEGATLTVAAIATDPDAGQTLTYSLDKSAPSGAQIDPNTGVLTWRAPAAGQYSVTVWVTDSGLFAKSDTQTFTITVADVAPTVNTGSTATSVQGATFTRSGSFDDPGSEVWKAAVDYGDGTPSQPLALDSGKAFVLSHAYVVRGTYVVTVTIDDGIGGIGRGRFTVNVAENPSPPALVRLTSVRTVTDRHKKVTKLIVDFSGAVNPAQAAFVTTYRLATAGKGGSFDSKKGVKLIKVRSAVYDATSHSVTLALVKPFVLKKPIQLRINGLAPSGLDDPFGRLIDGDHDGRPGGNAVALLGKRSKVTFSRLAPANATVPNARHFDALIERDGLNDVFRHRSRTLR